MAPPLEIGGSGARIAPMNANVPDALLLIAPGCPHCQAALNNLSEMVKKGEIGRLEVVNIAVHPEAAQQAGVRSVPWTRLGPFELAGEYTLGELRDWAKKSAGGAGADYIRELLEQQQLDEAVTYLEKHPETASALLDLMREEEQSLGVKFGVGAIFDALAGSDTLRSLVPELEKLARSPRADLRADAAHYLGLAGDPGAIPILETLTEDENPDVREIAAESLEALRS